MLNTRFSERIFIPNVRTRSLLKTFCIKGITPAELLELDQLVTIHAPYIAPLLQLLKEELDTSLPILSCPHVWCKFIGALASSSPVCALVHPSDSVFNLLKHLVSHDITMNPSNMELLQREIPVLFELVKNKFHLPRRSLSPIVDKIIQTACAPFTLYGPETQAEPDNQTMMQELAYFPSLPKVRTRGIYDADHHARHMIKCTKLSSGHPSLLPGIFTLFCPHGEHHNNVNFYNEFYMDIDRYLLWISSHASP